MQTKTFTLKSIITAFFIISSLVLLGQYDTQNTALDAMIEKGIVDWEIPALSVLVLKDGNAVYKKTYGIKNIKSKEAANNETMFTMASTTKALVAMGMAMLVDEGKVKWEDKVRMHYPQFKLSNAYITEDARIKDLFTHNLGIGNADWIWYARDLNTAETIEKFAQAPQVHPLRGGYKYQNMAYVIAGEVIKKISGKPWQDFLNERIFKPLNMNRTAAVSKNILALGNVARPHYNDLDEGIIPINYAFFDQAGAAGMLYSCIDDIEKYLSFINNKGILNGDTLIKASTFEYLFSPKIIIENGFYPSTIFTKPKWKSYAMGWFQHDYKGMKVDFHTGSIDGFVAIHGWLRDQNLGVYVFSNLDGAELRHAIMYKVFDLYALGGDTDWHKNIFDLYDGFKQENIKSLELVERSRVRHTKPSKFISAYNGIYTHPMFGKITIKTGKNNLSASLNDKYDLTLNHWHYDTFRSNVQTQWRERVMIRFEMDENGNITGLFFKGKEYKKKQ
ncbi:MAG: serine hydrolase [Saprospiraceae bacterium]